MVHTDKGDKMKIIGRYISENETIAYEVVDAFGDRHMYGKEQLIYFIGRGDIANGSVYMQGLKAYIRLTDGNIRDLPEIQFNALGFDDEAHKPKSVGTLLKDRVALITETYNKVMQGDTEINYKNIGSLAYNIGNIYTIEEFRSILAKILNGYGVPSGYTHLMKIYQSNINQGAPMIHQLMATCNTIISSDLAKLTFSNKERKLIALQLMLAYGLDCIQRL